MDTLKTMWESIPPATPEDLAGARRRLLDGMHARRRVVTVPRLLVAAGVAAAVAVTPLFVGTGTSAYAVSRSPDGTLTVTLSGLRDPEGLEAELGKAGVKADVTFLEPGMRCVAPRFVGVDESYGGPPVDGPDELREQVRTVRSFKAIRASSGTFQIYPEYIKPHETLVLEFSDGENAQVLWRLGSWLAKAGSPVKPCTPVAMGN
ncbi:hypothetical protein ETD86_49875 [Nonomuraea turkmeniaca]|uniref:Uncharacterized protein n=2 Tax=Nonomuraea turkmeniaca TaxID=103838 RepID=A0A5S4EWE1_9ACTN|nr:hypothetical protein ETD86_49875 [Nonomuraea turkmeniaca]